MEGFFDLCSACALALERKDIVLQRQLLLPRYVAATTLAWIVYMSFPYFIHPKGIAAFILANMTPVEDRWVIMV